MTQTLMGALQAAIRAVTGKTFQDFNGDLHDLCDLYAVPAAPISGRVIPVARLFDSTISSASAALNYLLANPTTVVGPTGLFTGGVQGAWYDPSDLSTLFQDSAGTTPVTAVEQAVGLMLDKSGRGNHAFQSTSASRPTLRARYNLLTYSEQFDNAAWVATNSSISANVTTAPDGTLTADKLIENTATAAHQVYQNYLPTATLPLTFSVYAKAAERTVITLLEPNGIERSFNLVTGVATGSGASMQFVGNGWWRCISSGSAPDLLTRSYAVRLNNGSTTNYTGDGTSGAFIWGAQLVPTAVFPSNTYQRIGAATDYATGAAFPPYLFFDGTDDSMLTNSVDFATVTSDGQARRNLLSNPTQFDAAGWRKTDATVVANAGTAPDGTVTADLIYPTTTGTIRGAYQAFTASATTYTGSLYVKAAGKTAIRLVEFPGSLTAASVDLTTGAVSGVLAGYTVTTVDAQNGWWRVIYTASATAGTRYVQFMVTDNVSTSTATTNGTDGALFWGAQLETGSTATAFQNIGTDKMLVVAGVTKQGTSAGIIGELSPDTNTNNGSFMLVTDGVANDWFWRSKGTVAADARATPYTSPITNVVAGIGNIGGDISQNRVNGTVITTSTTDQGTGNYGNYPLFIGRRNNASLPFNGNLYSLIIAGQSYSSGQISSTESWVAAKTPLGTI